jgi:hypothetical protein
MKKEESKTLLEQEMDRKEFLGYVGAVALSVAGIGGMIEAMMKPTKKNVASTTDTKQGYGKTSYGRG